MANTSINETLFEQGRTLRKYDKVLIIEFLVLVVFGWMTLLSSRYVSEAGFVWSDLYAKQLIFMGITLFSSLFVFRINSRTLDNLSLPIYAITILLLLGVFVLGKEVNGARSWYGIGGISLQPGEFAKLGTSLMVAKYISSPNFSIKNIRDQLTITGIILLPALLIILQPDVGTAVVFTSLFFVLYREGLNGWLYFIVFICGGILFLHLYLTTSPIVSSYIAQMTGLVSPDKDVEQVGKIIQGDESIQIALNTFVNYIMIAFFFVLSLVMLFFNFRFIKERRDRVYRVIQISVVFGLIVAYILSLSFIFNNVFKEHHRNRLKVMFNENIDPYGVGFNLKQSKTAIGYGQWLGEGFLDGKLTKGEFVPERSTDYIFCNFAEEWGFVGSAIIVIIYLFFIGRIFYLAENNEQVYTRIYGYCLGCILLLHVTANLGMIMGVLPTIGIPLPFFSYGGSSFLVFALMVMIFLRLESQSIFNS